MIIRVLSKRMFCLVVGLIMSGAAIVPACAQAPAPISSTFPWSAAASTVVVGEEKTFQSAGTKLSGTLYYPAGRTALGAIVVTHGASSPLRSSPLYRHLMSTLPSLGMAVFVYDRRGSGKSEGNLQTSDYAMLADDAIAAAQMLSSDPRIDPKRIGIWGLSQGGWLALLAASRSPHLAFVVSISAPVVTPDVQMLFSSTNTLRVNGYPQTEIDQMIAMRQAVDNYMRGSVSRTAAQERVDAASQKPWFKYMYMSEKVGDRATSRWRKEIEYDPMQAIMNVRVPALVIYGANDPVVPVSTSVARLASVHATRPNIKVVVIAGADHGMQTTVDPKKLLDPNNSDAEQPDAAEYFGILANWLTKQGIADGFK